MRFSSAEHLTRGAKYLVSLQKEDHWEGEVVWCPMLAAQYTLAMHVMEQSIPAERRSRILRHFRDTQLPSGLWGLSPHSPDSLFVTTLVYVASRTLGLDADDPLLAAAREFFVREGGVAAIPSWGKAWLALMNLYSWDGVNAVPAEMWLLPKSLPLHPANYYCHTRLIYMGMASVYALKLRARRSSLIDALRAELYPQQDYRAIDWASHRGDLRRDDLWAPPGQMLRAAYQVSNVFERVHPGALRRRALAKLRESIRWELRTTDYTCLSPVNGLLFMLTLWAHDPDDEDLQRQLSAFEGWVWEDETEGFRVTGARSATWDTSFILQSLVHTSETDALASGLRWLQTQQIQRTFRDHAKHDRVDPRGGFCFAGVWHGWPVSDCTAEAVCAFLEAPSEVYVADPAAMQSAIEFLLQCQNFDGGFGSYEARKHRVRLEWLNPAEMFGDSMTEYSYYECTASNLMALCAFRERYPRHALRSRVDAAIGRAEAFLRDSQNEDGSWTGVWGVAFLYGTLFGVRGLMAAGAHADDPAIVRACDFVRGHQRGDGSWGEDLSASLTDVYCDLGHGHATQTAWALMTLLAGGQLDDAVEAGARALSSMQLASGDWPQQEMAGVFFRTAFLDYRLYRRIFPVWALGLYEQAVATDRRTSGATPPTKQGNTYSKQMRL